MDQGANRRLRDILIYLAPFLVMVLLFIVSSIPGDPSGIPRDSGPFKSQLTQLTRLVSLVPAMVHNILHIPGYLLLAWTLYLPLGRWLKPTTCLILTLALATAYGVLMEMNQMGIPGRYPSFGDAFLNFIGALLGCLLAGRSLRQRLAGAPARFTHKSGFDHPGG
jgi:VanZ family protein